MIQIINIKTTTNSAFYNKGVVAVVPVAESLSTERKKDERNIAKYLVVPNICILSLSLVKPGLSKILIFCVRAREGPHVTLVNKGLL